ncbi:MAG: hypothetical protein QOE80_3292, partial [Actinomycetota bacterium]|nr:hypothetical protein [Actinomycetota bacterium]
MGEVFVLGVRHHGPGSARAVGEALAEIQPDAVLIEGAPELDAVAALAGGADMVPPVAGLVYAVDEPRRSAFYPLADFSPEWVALRWALRHGRAVKFCDLPAANALAIDAVALSDGDRQPRGGDPIGTLAAAAGYDDPERWWEDVIEHRYHGAEIFAVVTEAMAALRQADPSGAGIDGDGDDGDGGGGVSAFLSDGRPSEMNAGSAQAGALSPSDEHNERREAAMRKAIRAALAGGAQRVAVVCGAWHAPALEPGAFPTASADAARLKGLPKLKVAATWVPWTSALLARRSGYGAGVDAPGWYRHLATAPDAAPTRFLVKAARLLRDRGHDVSPAATVEAVRLAEGLAALRSRPGPGLGEVLDAAEAALAGGSPVPLRLISAELLVGHDLGSVPDDTPMVPLARDLAKAQRRLRLPASAAPKTLELDLRTDSHRQRSQLLHRLAILGVDWGQPADTGRTGGTFKEVWALQWHPSFEVALVEASAAGTTIESAAAATLTDAAAALTDPGDVAALVEEALLAELPTALAAVTATLAERAARQRDTARLMAAVEPLARTRRYGNVRRVDTEAVAPVLAGLLTRIAVGLPAAVAAVDDDGAAGLSDLVESVDRAVGLLDDPALRQPWLAALRAVADQRGVHGLLAGRAVRVLLDSGVLDAGDVQRRLSRALSRADEAARGAAWIEGFLTGDASLLLHDPTLLRVVDDWVSEVRGAVFDELLPVLRRTFATFPAPDRRALGSHLRRLEDGTAPADADDTLDPERAARVLPRLRELL